MNQRGLKFSLDAADQIRMKCVILSLWAAFIAMAADAPASVAAGSYECWANGQARLLMNFTIKSATQYADYENKPGIYQYDSKSGKVAFKGGGLDGVMPDGFTAIYHVPQGRPTVSFRSPRGAEAAFCEKK